VRKYEVCITQVFFKSVSFGPFKAECPLSDSEDKQIAAKVGSPEDRAFHGVPFSPDKFYLPPKAVTGSYPVRVTHLKAYISRLPSFPSSRKYLARSFIRVRLCPAIQPFCSALAVLFGDMTLFPKGMPFSQCHKTISPSCGQVSLLYFLLKTRCTAQCLMLLEYKQKGFPTQIKPRFAYKKMEKMFKVELQPYKKGKKKETNTKINIDTNTMRVGKISKKSIVEKIR